MKQITKISVVIISLRSRNQNCDHKKLSLRKLETTAIIGKCCSLCCQTPFVSILDWEKWFHRAFRQHCSSLARSSQQLRNDCAPTTSNTRQFPSPSATRRQHFAFSCLLIAGSIASTENPSGSVGIYCAREFKQPLRPPALWLYEMGQPWCKGVETRNNSMKRVEGSGGCGPYIFF